MSQAEPVIIIICYATRSKYIMKWGTMHSTCHFFTFFFVALVVMAEMSSPLNPFPPLPPPIGDKCCDACIAQQLAVPTNHKCYQCGLCLHVICNTMELEDPMHALGNDSVCHDCYRMMKQIQLLISSSQIPWVSSSILNFLIVIICYY